MRDYSFGLTNSAGRRVLRRELVAQHTTSDLILALELFGHVEYSKSSDQGCTADQMIERIKIELTARSLGL